MSPRMRPPLVVLTPLTGEVEEVGVGSGDVSGCMSQFEGVVSSVGVGLLSVVGIRFWLRIVMVTNPIIRMATRPVRNDFICPILYTMESILD